nr:uncharacterized protein LOC104106406 [Nicotiana tomentosiformis]
MASVQCSKPTQQNNHVQSSTVCNKTCTPTSQKAVGNKTSTPTSQKAVGNKTSTPTSQKANNERHSFTDKMKEMAHKMFHHEHQTQNGQKAHTQQLHQSVCHESCATHGTHANHSQHSSYHGSTHTTTNGRKKMEGHCMPTMQMRKKNKEEKYKFSDSSSSSDDSDNEKCGQKKN